MNLKFNYSCDYVVLNNRHPLSYLPIRLTKVGAIIHSEMHVLGTYNGSTISLPRMTPLAP